MHLVMTLSMSVILFSLSTDASSCATWTFSKLLTVSTSFSSALCHLTAKQLWSCWCIFSQWDHHHLWQNCLSQHQLSHHHQSLAAPDNPHSDADSQTVSLKTKNHHLHHLCHSDWHSDQSLWCDLLHLLSVKTQTIITVFVTAQPTWSWSQPLSEQSQLSQHHSHSALQLLQSQGAAAADFVNEMTEKTVHIDASALLSRWSFQLWENSRWTESLIWWSISSSLSVNSTICPTILTMIYSQTAFVSPFRSCDTFCKDTYRCFERVREHNDWEIDLCEADFFCKEH